MTFGLSAVSVTGPDDETRIDDLNGLAQEFPFVEFAVLYDPQQCGQKRFPARPWIESFSSRYQGKHRAMHLCNRALIDFSKGDTDVAAVMAGFGRIQLNFKFGNAGKKVDMPGLVRRVGSMPDTVFILQYGADGHDLLAPFGHLSNVALLFDKSAGAGILPDSWPAPVPGFRCGYAGGLNPDNVVAQVEKIAQAAPGYTTWIDMESGVRTDDCFDLAKVRRVLQSCMPYIRAERKPGDGEEGREGGGKGDDGGSKSLSSSLR